MSTCALDSPSENLVNGLRWVEEYHVDGFRFDLASALCRDPLGEPIPAPPLIRQIAKDPVLSRRALPCFTHCGSTASPLRAALGVFPRKHRAGGSHAGMHR